MKSAAFGWSEMARCYEGGDEHLKYKTPGIFFKCCITVAWGKEDTATYTEASNTLLISMLR
jgi:hypothetical protein